MKWFKRIVVSIAVIIAFFIIVFWTLACWFEYHEKHYFQDRGRIERITGVALPKFKVTSYDEGGRGFTGDYNDSFFLSLRILFLMSCLMKQTKRQKQAILDGEKRAISILSLRLGEMAFQHLKGKMKTMTVSSTLLLLVGINEVL